MNHLEILLVTGAFVVSFILVILIVPSVLKVANARNLYDETDIQKIHKAKVCSFGGIVILIFGFSFSLIPFYIIYRSSQRFRKGEQVIP